MKSTESKQKPNTKSGRPSLNSGHNHERIVIENICEPRAEPSDGVALQMTLLFFTTRTPWVRASKVAIAHFHSLAQGVSWSRPFSDKEVISNRSSDAWLVKVVCTLFIRSHLSDTCLGYLSKNLTPLIAFEVVRRLNNPKLGLKFFEFSRESLSVSHTLRTYNLLMRSLCQMGAYDSAKVVFDCMRSDGHLPDSSIVAFLVSSYTQVGKFDLAKKFLAEAQRDKVGLSIFVYNKLLDELVRWNMVDEAVCLFREHMELHSHPDTFTFNILIRGLCRMGEVDQAFVFFNDMGSFGCSPDAVTYNTLINGLCRVNEVNRGHELLKEVRTRGEPKPDVVTYTSLILGYCKLGKMYDASVLFDEMINSGIKPNAITFNVLIDGFGKAGDMLSALSMYEKMLFLGYFPDVVTFTSLIDGYCRTGQVNRGLKLWHEMSARNVGPNVYTYSVLINGLSKENRMHEARDLLRQLKCSDIVPKPFMYNPVIDLFCKAGNVDEANEIVAEMEEKKCKLDKVTFTILIIGHCMKGRMFEAISIFNKMLSIGCAPDTITVNSLISCLLKAGMPNEAFHIKQTVSQDLDLFVPSLKRTIPVGTNMDIPMAV
ncbi:hypothetical protein I3842_03G195800 [Carya illinoinensis]|uniref:Pentatricopeptide repeat-containing protein n=3 Tax=Carya illinoinensis TaxID=32201 RepID=A0A922FMT1_CARIL|nr:hypothetical protein I3842_03G195800 [Carya illinoinensis]KAG6723164.1 hypothetical protein I3842_03G195800 [Carya illinoinensis]KAG6723165.1 hypothetical protein I3842_03G195800 [Carya illinoinensis]KAG6723166.1 hypothetical protein I3842_03G195800 [Carya illinoinensis]KAG6723167.1 hypothetical protein I3842_03G195800 [Carya illinoinensis]